MHEVLPAVSYFAPLPAKIHHPSEKILGPLVLCTVPDFRLAELLMVIYLPPGGELLLAAAAGQ